MYISKIKLLPSQDVADIKVGEMTGASATKAGTSGSIPAPVAGEQDKFFRGDGSWADPTASVGITDSEWAQIKEIL